MRNADLKRIVFATFSASLALLATGGRDSYGAVINGALVASVSNQVVDFDREIVLNSDGSLKTSGSLVQGDILATVARYGQVNSAFLSDDFGSNYQLSSISLIQIAAKPVDVGGGLANFTFNPVTTSPNLSASLGLTGIFGSSNLGAGNQTMTWVYENPSTTSAQKVNFSNGLTTVFPNQAASGNLITTLGENNGNDFWYAYGAPSSITNLNLLPGQNATPPSTVFFGLGVITNPGNLLIDPGAQAAFTDPSLTTTKMVDVGGNASLLKPATTDNSAWQVQTHTTVDFVALPEPGSMLIWLGLASVIGVCRKTQRWRKSEPMEG